LRPLALCGKNCIFYFNLPLKLSRMKYLNPAFFKFLDGLAKNNNKEWFDANREGNE
jgi:hypothetical protein